MTETTSFAERIRERYPEGLTGVFAIGGTRTAYIFGKNREVADPGHIHAMDDYADYGLDLLKDLISAFFDLGGQHIVLSVLSYQLLDNTRGSDYTEITAKLCLKLMQEDWRAFYRNMGIDPYFTGIDTLLNVPAHSAYELGVECKKFNEGWGYKEGRHKLIWEIAPIPLFSIWRAHEVMGKEAQADLETSLEQCHDMQQMHDLLYKYYAHAVYGTEIPVPHFYVGTNRKGDFKLRAMLPIALLCGDPFRLYYIPYPSLMIKRETLKTIIQDLAFGTPSRSKTIDYSGQITSEVLEAEYQRVQELSADPYSTVGLVRRVQTGHED